VAEGSGSVGFARELFAETVAYYASRDLPSYVGKRGRVSNVSELIELKRQLQNQAREVASAKQLARRLTHESWSTFVHQVVDVLASKRGKR
jgi:pyridoxine/pyridoxamine 5'-phosphate oxidase